MSSAVRSNFFNGSLPKNISKNYNLGGRTNHNRELLLTDTFYHQTFHCYRRNKCKLQMLSKSDDNFYLESANSCIYVYNIVLKNTRNPFWDDHNWCTLFLMGLILSYHDVDLKFNYFPVKIFQIINGFWKDKETSISTYIVIKVQAIA